MIEVWVVICFDDRIHDEFNHEPSHGAAIAQLEEVEQGDFWPCGPHRVAKLVEVKE